jgi:hypothetical protein
MRYLLDKNILSNRLLSNDDKRTDLYVLKDVVEEFTFSSIEEARIKSNGISVVNVTKKHLEKLKEVLFKHGENLKLINLYKAKGGADIMMLAFILAEKEKPDTLFREDYTLITNDTQLILAAESYNIPCKRELI